jgi:Protein of unknown function (DUF2630)
MNDQEILDYITQLVHEERRLWEGIASGQLGDEVKARLRSLEVQLDQYWDLLRQRQRRREPGSILLRRRYVPPRPSRSMNSDGCWQLCFIQ